MMCKNFYIFIGKQLNTKLIINEPTVDIFTHISMLTSF